MRSSKQTETELPCNFWWDSNPRRDAEIADIGLTKPLALEELLKLGGVHHHAGPERDDWEADRCAVHKFRYPLSQHGKTRLDVYVKVGLKEHPKRKGIYIAKIYSFKRWK